MRRRAPLIAVCVAILNVSLCAGQDSSVFFVPEHERAPAFTLPDVDGRTVTSKNFAGRVAVLSFGATWCASCVSELKSLEKLQQRFPNDLSVYFVALDGHGAADVKPFMNKHDFHVTTLIDAGMAVAREHGIRWIPVTVIVDRHGFIAGRAIGPREWDGKEAVDLVQSVMRR